MQACSRSAAPPLSRLSGCSMAHDIIAVFCGSTCYGAHDVLFAVVAAVFRIRRDPFVGKYVRLDHAQTAAGHFSHSFCIFEFKLRLKYRSHIVSLHIGACFQSSIKKICRIDASGKSDRSFTIHLKILFDRHCFVPVSVKANTPLWHVQDRFF